MSEAGTQQIANGEQPTVAVRSFAQRFVGAFRLDGTVYEEVASDPGAIGQAAGVVVIAAAARAAVDMVTGPSGTAIYNAVFVFSIWPIVAFLVWGVGYLLRLPASAGRVLRATGFAMAPFTLVILGLAPITWIQVGASLVALALFFGAAVVSVRPALRVDTGRSALVCAIVGLAFVLLFSLVKYAVTR
jgi:hypothetical protein